MLRFLSAHFFILTEAKHQNADGHKTQKGKVMSRRRRRFFPRFLLFLLIIGILIALYLYFKPFELSFEIPEIPNPFEDLFPTTPEETTAEPTAPGEWETTTPDETTEEPTTPEETTEEPTTPEEAAEELPTPDETTEDPTTPDFIPVKLQYRINSDGVTCSITGMGTCKELKLVIPKTIDSYRVTCIDDSAFLGSELISVTIPNSVTKIGYAAFKGCSALTNLTIPKGVESIGKNAFEGCTSLTSVAIPDSVTQIEKNAFYNCPSLNAVHITDLAAWCKIYFTHKYSYELYNSNPLQYAHNLYLNGELITDLVISSETEVIRSHAFAGCTSLTSVTILDGVKYIHDNAFGGCTSLTGITIPSSVKSISRNTFFGCEKLIQEEDGVLYVDKWVVGSSFTSLAVVALRESTVGICDDAFYDSALVNITIPDSVTSIGKYAFYDCALMSITFEGTVAQWRAINKASSWNYNVPPTEVICSDGVVQISSQY